jgi:hypothetical protein
MVVADVWHRGVPWVRLLLGRRHTVKRATLNVRRGEQVLTSLAAVGMILGVAALVTGWSGLFLLAALGASLTVAGDWRFSMWLARSRGWWFALRTVPLRLLYYVLNVVSVGIGSVQACADRRLSAALPRKSAVRQAGSSPAWNRSPARCPDACSSRGTHL